MNPTPEFDEYLFASDLTVADALYKFAQSETMNSAARQTERALMLTAQRRLRKPDARVPGPKSQSNEPPPGFPIASRPSRMVAGPLLVREMNVGEQLVTSMRCTACLELFAVGHDVDPRRYPWFCCPEHEQAHKDACRAEQEQRDAKRATPGKEWSPKPPPTSEEMRAFSMLSSPAPQIRSRPIDPDECQYVEAAFAMAEVVLETYQLLGLANGGARLHDAIAKFGEARTRLIVRRTRSGGGA